MCPLHLDSAQNTNLKGSGGCVFCGLLCFGEDRADLMK